MKRLKTQYCNIALGLDVERLGVNKQYFAVMQGHHTHTHTGLVVSGYGSVTGPPSFTLERRGSQRTEDSTTKAFFFLLLYCFLPKKRSTKDGRDPSTTSPWPPTDPLLLGGTGPQWAGGLPF